MNYSLKKLPERTSKPREVGYTMSMDKGLSIREAEDFMDSCADYVDIVKLGWATSYVTKNLETKIKVFKDAGVPCYFGGEPFLKPLSSATSLMIIAKYWISITLNMQKSQTAQ